MLKNFAICLLALATLPALASAQASKPEPASDAKNAELIPVHISQIHSDQRDYRGIPFSTISTTILIDGVKLEIEWDEKGPLFQRSYRFPLGDYKVSIPKPNTPPNHFDLSQEIDIHQPDGKIIKAWVIGYSE